MEHLLGCHGEWFFVAQAVAAIPIVGVYLRALIPVAYLRALIPVRVRSPEHNHD
jgi:hypothetical protein